MSSSTSHQDGRNVSFKGVQIAPILIFLDEKEKALTGAIGICPRQTHLPRSRAELPARLPEGVSLRSPGLPLLTIRIKPHKEYADNGEDRDQSYRGTIGTERQRLVASVVSHKGHL